MPARVAACDRGAPQARTRTSRARKKTRHGRRRQARRRDGVASVGDIKLLARAVDGIDIKDLQAAWPTKARSRSAPASSRIVGVSDDGKAGIVVGVTADLDGALLSAVDLVRKGAEALGGKGGGGRPDMAQAGGPDGAKAEAALAAVAAAIGGD